jgi:hypothetical protein
MFLCFVFIVFEQEFNKSNTTIIEVKKTKDKKVSEK